MVVQSAPFAWVRHFAIRFRHSGGRGGGNQVRIYPTNSCEPAMTRIGPYGLFIPKNITRGGSSWTHRNQASGQYCDFNEAGCSPWSQLFLQMLPRPWTTKWIRYVTRNVRVDHCFCAKKRGKRNGWAAFGDAESSRTLLLLPRDEKMWSADGVLLGRLGWSAAGSELDLLRW